jgi:hypothetical protein
MIDSALLRRLLLIAAALLVIAAAACVLSGAPRVAGGLGLGFLLGAAPFASWSWVLSRAMASKRGRALAAVLMILKLGAYAGALYLTVTRDLVSPVGVLAGMLGVGAVLVVGVLWGAPAAPAKEVS